MKNSKHAGRIALENRVKKTQRSVATVRAMLNINDEIGRITTFLEEVGGFENELLDLALIDYGFNNFEGKVFQKIKEGEKDEIN